MITETGILYLQQQQQEKQQAQALRENVKQLESSLV